MTLPTTQLLSSNSVNCWLLTEREEDWVVPDWQCLGPPPLLISVDFLSLAVEQESNNSLSIRCSFACRWRCAVDGSDCFLLCHRRPGVHLCANINCLPQQLVQAARYHRLVEDLQQLPADVPSSWAQASIWTCSFAGAEPLELSTYLSSCEQCGQGRGVSSFVLEMASGSGGVGVAVFSFSLNHCLVHITKVSIRS